VPASDERSDTPGGSLTIGGMAIEPGDRIGGYVYRRVIGKGGMALVVLADDPDGRPIALKILKAGRIQTGLTRFKREFRALAKLRHPNIIRVDAYGDVYGHPYIAMEYVEGTDLHQEIHRLRDVDAAERHRRCEAILADLCHALSYIHRRGLIHRDLKPSNVLIDRTGRCKLTDFGIVKDLDASSDALASTTLVGTWAYASPEQITGQPLDHRTDLYSLGVILFAMLTGRRPFAAKDLAGYLELHRAHVIPPPRDLEPDIPELLDDVTVRLLRKMPRDRPQSAREVLYRLEAGEGDPAAPEPAGWTPPLVGRSAQTDNLRARLAGLTRDESGVVLIEGEAGSGRTRLLELAVAEAGQLGFPAYAERVSLRDGTLGPILRLVEAMRRDLGPRAPADLVGAVIEVTSPQPGPSARARLHDALVATLAAVGEGGPVLVAIDELQNAQAATVDALAHMVGEQREVATLLVGTVRAGSRATRLGTLRREALAVVTADPLSEAEVGELVASLIGPGRAATALARRLHAETWGNISTILHFIQSLQARGMIAAEGAGWRLIPDLEEVAVGYLEMPAPVRQAVSARLVGLRGAEMRFAQTLAVCDCETELDVLLGVLDLSEEDAADVLDHLGAVGVVGQRRSGQQVLVGFAGPLYRELLYRELDPDGRAAAHARLAEVLEARYGADPSAARHVGEHYRRAGEAGKALRYLAAAAGRMAARSQPTEAWEVGERALELEDQARVELGADEFGAVKRQLLEVRAEIQFIRGEWWEAREALEAAVSLAEAARDEEAAVAGRIRVARVLRNLGELDEAEAAVQAQLPRARALHVRAAIAEGLLVLSHVAWARGDLDKCESAAQEGLMHATGPNVARARADLLLALTAVQASRGHLQVASTGLRDAERLYQDVGARGLRAAALANLAEVELGQGESSAAWQHGSAALDEARASGRGPGEVAALRILGAAALQLGDLEEASRHLEQARERAKDLEIGTELVAIHYLTARVRLAAGEARAALRALDLARLDAKDGDPEHYLPVIAAARACSLALVGEPEAAREAIATAEAALVGLPALRRAQATLEVAQAHVYLGEAERGLALALSAGQAATVRGFRMLALESLVLAAAACPDPAERGRLLAEARRMQAAMAAALPARWAPSFRSRAGFG
jgi:tetratricopeptide (TPR) repeat protein